MHPRSETVLQQARSFDDALKAAGMCDHIDPDGVLHEGFYGETPTTAPDVTTVGTEQLAAMLQGQKPLGIDAMVATWYHSVPGAVGLDFHGNTHGTFTDEVQKRFERKLHELTAGDMTMPIVAVGWNAATFGGYNLALRIRHAGYANVYWYRGGREAGRWPASRTGITPGGLVVQEETHVLNGPCPHQRYVQRFTARNHLIATKLCLLNAGDSSGV